MERPKPLSRLVSLLVLVCFSTQIAFGSLLQSKSLAPAPQFTSSLNQLMTVVPRSLMNVGRAHEARTSEAPIILIQDVHLNSEAQQNIAKTLQRFVDQKSVADIYVEGAFDRFDFRRFNSKRAGEKAQQLLEQKKIAAHTFVGLTASNHLPEITGVDDPAAYDENVSAYLAAVTAKKGAESNWSQRLAQHDASREEILTSTMLQMDRLNHDYQSAKLPLSNYLDELSRLSEPTDLLINQFLEASHLEKTLDYSRVDRERKSVLEELGKKLSDSELKQLISLTATYRSGDISFGDYYRALRNVCDLHQVNLKKFPAFLSYVQYTMLADGIDANEILKAVSQWENELIDSLHPTVRQRQCLSEGRQLRLERKLLDFALTTEEWREYARGRAGEGERGSNDLLPFVRFYQLADRRSEKMVDTLLSRRSSSRFVSRRLSSVLITGGFHTAEITELLKAREISFVVLSPRLTKIDEKASDYLSVFAQQKSPLDKLLSGHKLFLSPASVQCVGEVNTLATAELKNIQQQIGIAKQTEQLLGERELHPADSEKLSSVLAKTVAFLCVGMLCQYLFGHAQSFDWTFVGGAIAAIRRPTKKEMRAARRTEKLRKQSELPKSASPSVENRRSFLRKIAWPTAGVVAAGLLTRMWKNGTHTAPVTAPPSTPIAPEDRPRQEAFARFVQYPLDPSPQSVKGAVRLVGKWLQMAGFEEGKLFDIYTDFKFVSDATGPSVFWKRLLPDGHVEVHYNPRYVLDLFGSVQRMNSEDAFIEVVVSMMTREAVGTLTVSSNSAYVMGARRAWLDTTEPALKKTRDIGEREKFSESIGAIFAQEFNEALAESKIIRRCEAKGILKRDRSDAALRMIGHFSLLNHLQQNVRPFSDLQDPIDQLTHELIQFAPFYFQEKLTRPKPSMAALAWNDFIENEELLFAQSNRQFGISAENVKKMNVPSSMILADPAAKELYRKVAEQLYPAVARWQKVIETGIENQLKKKNELRLPGAAAATLLSASSDPLVDLWMNDIRAIHKKIFDKIEKEIAGTDVKNYWPAVRSNEKKTDRDDKIEKAIRQKLNGDSNPDFHIELSFKNGHVVGYVTYKLERESGPSIYRGAVFLDTLAVDPDEKSGIGTSLIKHVFLWAIGAGANQVYLKCYKQNAPANDLYEHKIPVRLAGLIDHANKGATLGREELWTYLYTLRAPPSSSHTTYVLPVSHIADEAAAVLPVELKGWNRENLLKNLEPIANFLADGSLLHSIEGRSDINDRIAIEDPLQSAADVMVVFGTGSRLVAERSADIFLAAIKKNPDFKIIFTGGVGRGTPQAWREAGLTEAQAMRDMFLKRLAQHGPQALALVTVDNVLLEEQSKNYGENVQFTAKMITKLKHDRVILLHHPFYALRGGAATWSKQSGLDGTTINFSAFRISLGRLKPAELVAAAQFMLGELNRLEDYAKPENNFIYPPSLKEIEPFRAAVKAELEDIARARNGIPLPSPEKTVLQSVEFGSDQSEASIQDLQRGLRHDVVLLNKDSFNNDLEVSTLQQGGFEVKHLDVSDSLMVDVYRNEIPSLILVDDWHFANELPEILTRLESIVPGISNRVYVLGNSRESLRITVVPRSHILHRGAMMNYLPWLRAQALKPFSSPRPEHNAGALILPLKKKVTNRVPLSDTVYNMLCAPILENGFTGFVQLALIYSGFSVWSSNAVAWSLFVFAHAANFKQNAFAGKNLFFALATAVACISFGWSPFDFEALALHASINAVTFYPLASLIDLFEIESKIEFGSREKQLAKQISENRGENLIDVYVHALKDLAPKTDEGRRRTLQWVSKQFVLAHAQDKISDRDFHDHFFVPTGLWQLGILLPKYPPVLETMDTQTIRLRNSALNENLLRDILNRPEMKKNRKPVRVLVAGGSGGGKSTFAESLAGLSSTYKHIGMDAYTFPRRERINRKLEGLNMYRWDIISDMLTHLEKAEQFTALVVDKMKGIGVEEVTPTDPRKLNLLVFEGILTLASHQLREAFDVAVFVDEADKHRFERRLKRDQRAKGYSPIYIAWTFATTQLDEFRMIRRSAEFANFIVNFETGVVSLVKSPSSQPSTNLILPGWYHVLKFFVGPVRAQRSLETWPMRAVVVPFGELIFIPIIPTLLALIYDPFWVTAFSGLLFALAHGRPTRPVEERPDMILPHLQDRQWQTTARRGATQTIADFAVRTVASISILALSHYAFQHAPVFLFSDPTLRSFVAAILTGLFAHGVWNTLAPYLGLALLSLPNERGFEAVAETHAHTSLDRDVLANIATEALDQLSSGLYTSAGQQVVQDVLLMTLQMSDEHILQLGGVENVGQRLRDHVQSILAQTFALGHRQAPDKNRLLEMVESLGLNARLKRIIGELVAEQKITSFQEISRAVNNLSSGILNAQDVFKARLSFEEKDNLLKQIALSDAPKIHELTGDLQKKVDAAERRLKINHAYHELLDRISFGYLSYPSFRKAFIFLQDLKKLSAPGFSQILNTNVDEEIARARQSIAEFTRGARFRRILASLPFSFWLRGRVHERTARGKQNWIDLIQERPDVKYTADFVQNMDQIADEANAMGAYVRQERTSGKPGEERAFWHTVYYHVPVPDTSASAAFARFYINTTPATHANMMRFFLRKARERGQLMLKYLAVDNDFLTASPLEAPKIVVYFPTEEEAKEFYDDVSVDPEYLMLSAAIGPQMRRDASFPLENGRFVGSADSPIVDFVASYASTSHGSGRTPASVLRNLTYDYSRMIGVRVAAAIVRAKLPRDLMIDLVGILNAHDGSLGLGDFRSAQAPLTIERNALAMAVKIQLDLLQREGKLSQRQRVSAIPVLALLIAQAHDGKNFQGRSGKLSELTKTDLPSNTQVVTYLASDTNLALVQARKIIGQLRASQQLKTGVQLTFVVNEDPVIFSESLNPQLNDDIRPLIKFVRGGQRDVTELLSDPSYLKSRRSATESRRFVVAPQAALPDGYFDVPMNLLDDATRMDLQHVYLVLETLEAIQVPQELLPSWEAVRKILTSA